MPTLSLYAHPFSSFSQKVLIALFENDTPFAYRRLDEPSAAAELPGLWPFKRFPVLVDGADVVAESSIIIEHLDLRHPGPVRFLPDDRAAALDVRFMDRFFDLSVQVPMQAIVGDSLRAPEDRSARRIAEAKAVLDTAYAWLETRLTGRTWASGETFSLADCAAAPALFYADWTHRIDASFVNVHAYRARLNARPAFARAIEEARPYRHLFPLGAPDRD